VQVPQEGVEVDDVQGRAVVMMWGSMAAEPVSLARNLHDELRADVFEFVLVVAWIVAMIINLNID
jgi:hypothetical protein